MEDSIILKKFVEEIKRVYRESNGMSSHAEIKSVEKFSMNTFRRAKEKLVTKASFKLHFLKQLRLKANVEIEM